MLVVQLVDKETGKPMSNLNVTIDDFDAIPVLFKCEFLPWSMRRRVSHRTTKTSDDGSFRTRRRVGAGGSPEAESNILVEVDGGRKFEIMYYDKRIYLRPSLDSNWDVELLSVPQEGTVVVPVDPSWMRYEGLEGKDRK
jgi:hypothetical protein